MDIKKTMKKTPKISVIMSVYNGLPFLKEAVKSILYQTYKNFEFIIVDDASSDKSWEYLRNLKDQRIKLIQNKKNLGLAASLNIALHQAKGDFIARMDADDISMPQRLKTQLASMLKNPSKDICGSWAKLINDTGEIINIVQKPTQDIKIKKMNQWTPALIHPTWFAKREVFDKLEGYNPDYDMVEDYDFLIRAKKFKMANINKVLLLWRSPRSRRSHKDIEKMYRKSLELRWRHFVKGDFGFSYLPLLMRSVISTYLFPTKLKIYLNERAGLV